ncbi:hypothetical protein [Dyella sp. Tek66A03]|uniref:hypothetical protein n=1 Tax=Dyella sp. Tek66A03 TaxID=3458298 RepID=UPI00403EB9F0
MIDEDLDLKIIFTDRRFLGVRIGVAGLAIAAGGFALGVLWWHKLGWAVMLLGWLVALAGFFAHISRPRV